MGNLRTILSNNRYRVALLFLDALLILLLLYLASYTFEYNKNLGFVNQLFALAFYASLLFFPLLYGYRSGLQILLEAGLDESVWRARGEIKRIVKQEKDFRALQARINVLRISLKGFIDYSEIVSPPVYSYELNRLQKGIDIFLNSTSEVLFSKPNIFSRAQRIERQETLEYYQSLEHPTNEELEEEYELTTKYEQGIIEWFGVGSLDEFLQYLGDTLFTPAAPYSPFSFKHPIDLITLSRFFDHWNSVVSSCRNCRRAYEKSKKDIEEYYKTEGRRERQRRQRMQRLRDDIVIVAVSVILSTIVQHLIGIGF